MELSQGRSGHQTGAKEAQKINVGHAERNASLVGGAALALTGIKALAGRRVLPGIAMMVAGGMFLYRGKTGHCGLYQTMGVDTSASGSTGVLVEKFVTINRSPQQVYDFWRNLENLPKFMKHLESVQVTGDNTSHWKARGPAGVPVEWDAEMVADYPGQLILWRSVGEASLPNEGTVEFREAPGDRGTELKVSIRYYPPGGSAGRAAAQMANAITAQQIEEDLKRLKQILETGETATAERTNNH